MLSLKVACRERSFFLCFFSLTLCTDILYTSHWPHRFSRKLNPCYPYNPSEYINNTCDMSQTVYDHIDGVDREKKKINLEDHKLDSTTDYGKNNDHPIAVRITKETKDVIGEHKMKRKFDEKVPKSSVMKNKLHRKIFNKTYYSDADDSIDGRRDDHRYWNCTSADEEGANNDENDADNNDDDDDDDRPVLEVIKDQRRDRSGTKIKRPSDTSAQKISHSHLKHSSYHSGDDSCTGSAQHHPGIHLNKHGRQIPSDSSSFFGENQSVSSNSGRPPLGPIGIGTGVLKTNQTGHAHTGSRNSDKDMDVNRNRNRDRDSGMRQSGANKGEVRNLLICFPFSCRTATQRMREDCSSYVHIIMCSHSVLHPYFTLFFLTFIICISFYFYFSYFLFFFFFFFFFFFVLFIFSSFISLFFILLILFCR